MQYIRKSIIALLLVLPFFTVEAQSFYWGVGLSYNYAVQPASQTTEAETFLGETRYQTLTPQNVDATGAVDLTAGYETSPLFWSQAIANNDVALKLSYFLPYKFNGERNEYQSGTLIADSESPYDYKIKLATLLLDYQLNFKIFSGKLNPLLDVEAGVADYSFADFQSTYNDVSVIENVNYGNHQAINLAYGAGVGLNYQIAEHENLVLGYRYLALGKAESGAGVGTKSDDTTVALGTLSQNLNINQIYLQFNYRM